MVQNFEVMSGKVSVDRMCT